MRALAAAGRRPVRKGMGYDSGPDRVEGGNEQWQQRPGGLVPEQHQQ